MLTLQGSPALERFSTTVRNSTPARPVETLQSESPQEAAAAQMRDVLKTASEGLKVTLSELGQARSAAKNDDIDDSGLPGAVKEILKLIRALKQQLEQKQAELQAVMQDQSLDPEARMQAAEDLRGEVSSLSGALAGANASLVDAMQGAGLSPEMQQTAAMLMMS